MCTLANAHRSVWYSMICVWHKNSMSWSNIIIMLTKAPVKCESLSSSRWACQAFVGCSLCCLNLSPQWRVPMPFWFHMTQHLFLCLFLCEAARNISVSKAQFVFCDSLELCCCWMLKYSVCQLLAKGGQYLCRKRHFETTCLFVWLLKFAKMALTSCNH